MIDYLFLDYLIVLARRQNAYVDAAFAQIVPNNQNCDELLKILGKEFDSKEWGKLKERTNLFKLTWKAEYPVSLNGRKTFYGKLISRELT